MGKARRQSHLRQTSHSLGRKGRGVILALGERRKKSFLPPIFLKLDLSGGCRPACAASLPPSSLTTIRSEPCVWPIRPRIPPSEPSGYARLGPVAARAVLAGWAFFACFCLAKMPTPPPTCEAKEQSTNNGDVALYRAEVDRIHAGENYYAAAARELVVRGYPTRSVFNWRTPLPMWLIGNLPDPRLGKALLGLLALGLLLAAFEATSREEKNIFRGPLPLAALMCGPLLPCLLGDLFVMPVLWAGIFIALSVCAYGLNRPYLGATAGLAAVFFRELALPYCLLGAALAAVQRRRGELAVWLTGLAAWTVFFGLHCAGGEALDSRPTPRPIATAGSNSAASPSSRRPCR